MERLEVPSGLDPELLGEQAASLVERTQRLGLASGAVQGPHLQRPQPLAKRVRVDEPTERGRSADFTVEEVPAAERPPIMAAYREKYGSMPTVSAVLTALPDPADHPVFRLHRRG